VPVLPTPGGFVESETITASAANWAEGNQQSHVLADGFPPGLGERPDTFHLRSAPELFGNGGGFDIALDCNYGQTCNTGAAISAHYFAATEVDPNPPVLAPITGSVLSGATLSPALAVAVLALIVAFVGTASAAQGAKTVIVRKGQIAKGAVTAKNLARGGPPRRDLRGCRLRERARRRRARFGHDRGWRGVGSSAIAPDAATSGASAPGSTYGGALGAVPVHAAPIADRDADPSNIEWTVSETVVASCGPWGLVLSGGVVFTSLAGAPGGTAWGRRAQMPNPDESKCQRRQRSVPPECEAGGRWRWYDVVLPERAKGPPSGGRRPGE
jgi:hypothetical protein